MWELGEEWEGLFAGDLLFKGDHIIHKQTKLCVKVMFKKLVRKGIF